MPTAPQPERIGQGVNCPECRGRGRLFAFASHADPQSEYGISCSSGWRDCSMCGGSGAVTSEFLQRYQAGRRMREDRINRGVSLREEAKRLGISAVELSARERGKTEIRRD